MPPTPIAPRERRSLPWLAGLFLASALALLPGCGTRGAPERPNLVLIVLDTARADMSSAYGWEAPTTPFLEELARAGTRFERAYSTSCWTLPAHASMFTGVLPDVHHADQLGTRVDAGLPLLATRLAAAGYQTAAFSRNPWVSERSGLERGFQRFGAVWPGADPARDARPTNPAVQDARRWLAAERDDGRPYFLFVNLIEPHMPYAPPYEAAQAFFPDRPAWQRALERYASGGVRALFERHYSRSAPLDAAEWHEVRALYEAELVQTDLFARRIVSAVDAVEDGRPTLLLVVSDHGENLGDHDHASHMFSLNEALTRVICIARGPGFAAGALDARLAQLVDVYPTLLAAAGLDPGPGPGLDLRAAPDPSRLLVMRVAWPRRWLDSFSAPIRASGVLAPYQRALWAARDERYKLVLGSDGEELLYDVESDPGESAPLSPTALEPQRLQRLRAAIASSRARSSGMPGDAPAEELGEGDLEALRALGYAR